MGNSKIFDQKYDECLSQMEEIDFAKRADILGGQYKDHSLIFNFFKLYIQYK
ncbi:MAG: hypothetical protein PF690_07165 [Deltaproteobacteria bacterium]|jgi:hypothetical protein|nr:hypothetical protein [Deltaproteobacteria bacterium]